MSRPQLHVHEWMAVMAITGFLLSFVVLAYLNREHHSIPPATQFPIPEIEVFVEGAVEKPGRLFIKKGSLVKDLLAQIKLTPDADISSLNPDSKLRNGKRIKIPSTQINIHISGAVAHPGWHNLPVNTRLADLPKHIELQEDADLKFFKKRRKLKDGETLIIPQKS